MHFRPYPVLTLVAIPALAILIGLGVWQLQRAEWKQGLIADYERAISAKPARPDEALCGDTDPLGKVVSAPESKGQALRVYGHNAGGDVGWRLFQAWKPACSGPSGGVLVETGFEPLSLGGEAAAPPPTPAAASSSFIVERWPGQQLMAAQNSPDTNEWHWFDAPAMAASLGQGALDNRYVLARLEGMPDYLARTTPEGHIWYAVTWFGMAIAFVVIYALFHARAGRLRFGKQQPPVA